MARKERARGPAWGGIIAGVLAIAALAAAWRYTPLSEYITAQRLSRWTRAVRDAPWAPALIVFIYTPASFLMFPRPLLTLISVVAFGAWLGFVYSMAGLMVAALATYYLGRALPEKTVARIAGERMQRLSERLRKHGFLAVLAWRTTPITPFALDGMMAGALRIKVVDYFLGTFVALLPGVLATTVFGKHIASVLEDPSLLNYWLLGGIVAVFAALTYGAGRWLSKQQA